MDINVVELIILLLLFNNGIEYVDDKDLDDLVVF